MGILDYQLFLPPKIPKWAAKAHPLAEIRAVFLFSDVEKGFIESEKVKNFYTPLGFSWRNLEIEGVGLALFAYGPPHRA